MEDLNRAAIVRQHEDMKTLAVEINAAHKAAEENGRRSIEHAIAAGERLIKAKGRCAHGEWLPWLEANVKFAQRTAARYVRAAFEKSKLATMANLTDQMEAFIKPVGDETEPDTSDAAETPAPPQPPAEVIYCRKCRTTGIKPNCKGCKQFRAAKAAEGKPKEQKPDSKPQRETFKFSWDRTESSLGYVVRAADALVKKYPDAKTMPEYQALEHSLDDVASMYSKLQKKLGK